MQGHDTAVASFHENINLMGKSKETKAGGMKVDTGERAGADGQDAGGAPGGLLTPELLTGASGSAVGLLTTVPGPAPAEPTRERPALLLSLNFRKQTR